MKWLTALWCTNYYSHAPQGQGVGMLEEKGIWLSLLMSFLPSNSIHTRRLCRSLPAMLNINLYTNLLVLSIKTPDLWWKSGFLIYKCYALFIQHYYSNMLIILVLFHITIQKLFQPFSGIQIVFSHNIFIKGGSIHCLCSESVHDTDLWMASIDICLRCSISFSYLASCHL